MNWPKMLFPEKGNNGVYLLNVINSKKATYGMPGDKGNWSMNMIMLNGKYISKIPYMEHLHNKKWIDRETNQPVVNN